MGEEKAKKKLEMLKLLGKLFKIGLLTPNGFTRLLLSFASEGTNLMALLNFAAKKFPHRTAVVDEKESVSYQDLFRQSKNLACYLQSKFQIQSGQKTAFVCRNCAGLVRALCAVSRIGSRIYLLNPEMTSEQFSTLIERHKFDFLFYDAEAEKLIQGSNWKNKSLNINEADELSKKDFRTKIKRAFSGEIIVLTGGTTGVPKTARRKSSVFKFLNPFFALLTKLDLDKYQTVYVATPAYHGFGISAVIIAIILGMKMFFLVRFDAEKACEIIEKNRVETMTVVPLMLQRMLNLDAQKLDSLECIISGGAALNPALVAETQQRLGDKLFNLYGTSEAGFSVIATPEDLKRSSETIGKKITGVNLKILDENDREVSNGKIGKVCIKSAWSIKSDKNWIETGDVGCQDENGFIFLRGRTDEMIVSGGENVYPVELENILVKHPGIRQVAVIGISDNEFGQRLKAFIVLKPEANLSENEIKKWLEPRIARFQMPARIEFLEELPQTAVGKINKKALS